MHNPTWWAADYSDCSPDRMHATLPALRCTGGTRGHDCTLWLTSLTPRTAISTDAVHQQLSMRIEGVIIPAKGDNASWDLEVTDGTIRSLQVSHGQPPRGLLVPALCHPHIHLDKPYILTGNGACPDYSDLVPSSGSFAEALSNTSKAKARYTADDLYLRGSQLLATSYRQGVTSLRAFVELDHVTGAVPLATAIRLKQDFSHLVEVQICAFAQDPIFSTEHAEANRSVIQSALEEHGAWIGALGTTPYVEQSHAASIENIEWAITTAARHGLHLDFHLDYNLRPPSDKSPLTYSVVDLLERHLWSGERTVVLGHCTQLSTLAASQLAILAKRIQESGLPVHFVGLPTSDMFMMGRPDDGAASPHARPRGTLHVPAMVKEFGLSACLGVNNVGNAFTPYGTGDPLQLASWGVGIYQAGTVDDAALLYSCVSWRARKAIGLEQEHDDGDIVQGGTWQPMMLVANEQDLRLPDGHGGAMNIPARQRQGFKDIVWDPPEVHMRSIVTYIRRPSAGPSQAV